MTHKRKVAILMFDEVEVLDFAGPFEVFGVTRINGEAQFHVFTVAATSAPVTARNGLKILPEYEFANCPLPDLLVVPGGNGTRSVMRDEHILNWVRAQAIPAELVLSVCTGALVIGAAGVLNGLKATTYHTAFDELRLAAPEAEVIEGQRWIDNGRVITSAGVSAGIDMSLYVVGRLLGEEVAQQTAAYMEYNRQTQP